MFFTLHLENQNGDRICMTDTANKYITSSVTGLSPPTGTINTAVYAGMDGSYLNNAFIEKQTIVIFLNDINLSIAVIVHPVTYRILKFFIIDVAVFITVVIAVIAVIFVVISVSSGRTFR